jgi:ketosteroid isomerase-like protein/predicted enzyme related to lactoylglutathione lyase
LKLSEFRVYAALHLNLHYFLDTQNPIDLNANMKIHDVDFIMYPVSDLTRAARFYRDILGLTQEMYSEEWQWAEFDCVHATLSLHGGVKLPETIAGARLALAVEDVQAAYAELKEKGVRMSGTPADYTVCQALEVFDPDGNPILLHHRADGTCGRIAAASEKEADTILALEKAALDRWAQGDPSGFLEISSPEVVYFDPTQEHRLDGWAELTRLYEGIRGQIHLTRYELLNPCVQSCGDCAVLTYNFVGESSSQTARWNCTEVYKRTPDGWRIIHTHWSFTQPALKEQ